jgi:hypothetical protein
VRLRGKDFSLKRSSALDGDHPRYLRTLETLHIFAVRANYMGQFRSYLEKEGVEVDPPIELPLFIQARNDFLKRGLFVPRPSQGSDFATEASLVLEPDPSISIHVDMYAHVEMIESTRGGVHSAVLHGGQELKIPTDSLNLVDWDKAYLDLLDYKARKVLGNLIIRPETPRQIIEQVECTVVGVPEIVSPRSFRQRFLLQEAISQLLREYMDHFYRSRREKWEEQSMVYRRLDESDPNLGFNRGAVREKEAPAYIVKIKRSEERLVKSVQRLIKQTKRLIQEENSNLPRIHFDRHLYLPLLLEQTDKAQMIPPGLKPSEANFVRDLKQYWNEEKDKSLAGKEVFLLRNLSRGKGIGFFDGRRFYPDFILWLLENRKQFIIFVEPHGIVYAKPYIHDVKAHLHERLPALAEEVGKRSGLQDIELDSYIISATPFDDARQRYDDGTWDREKFAEKHILFPERSEAYDYMKILLGQRTHSWAT